MTRHRSSLIALVVATNACVDRRVRRARGDLLSAPTAARSRCTRQARHCFFLTPPSLRPTNATASYLRVNSEIPAVYLVQNAARYVTRILRVVGVVTGSDDIGFRLSEGASGSSEEAVAPYISALVDFRRKLRAAARTKDSHQAMLDLCDELRDNDLIDLGVRIEDRTDGSSLWKREEPSVLRKELAEKRLQEEEKAKKKRAKQVVAARKAVTTAQAAAVPPAEMFKSMTDKYSEWGVDGIPTKTADGSDLAKAQTKKLGKAMTKQAKAFDKVAKQAEKGGFPDVARYIEELQNEVARKEAALEA